MHWLILTFLTVWLLSYTLFEVMISRPLGQLHLLAVDGLRYLVHYATSVNSLNPLSLCHFF